MKLYFNEIKHNLQIVPLLLQKLSFSAFAKMKNEKAITIIIKNIDDKREKKLFI